MRLVTYSVGPAGPARAGVRVGHRILDIETASRVKGEPLPASIKALLAAGRGAMSRVQALAKAATPGAGLVLARPARGARHAPAAAGAGRAASSATMRRIAVAERRAPARDACRGWCS